MRYFFIIVFFVNSLALVGQNGISFKQDRQHPGEIQDFAVDNLGNIYILYAHGQLKKLNENGDSVAVFNDVRKYGRAHSIDVSNPLKLILFYRDFGTIVILDRLLNPRSIIDLRRLGLLQVKSVAQSYDNNLWVFDELESVIRRVGDDGSLMDESTDLRMIFDSVPSPTQLIDQDRQLYLYDSTLGVFIFDYYGGFRQRIPFYNWKDFTVINKIFFGHNNNTLFRYEPGTLSLQEFTLPPGMAKANRIIIAPGKLYLLDSAGITIYQF